MPDFDLPYFDQIIARFDEQPDSELAHAFRRHVHWGCFDPDADVDDSLDQYVVAAEEMTRRICDAGRVGDGQRILDVGCGFGGTVDHLNQRFDGVTLVGLNIDGRQLARARQLVEARPGNTVSFVQADACRLPFPDDSFDAVTAVECAFHFPSRKRFFQEVARVTRPGATLSLSDFVLGDGGFGELGAWKTANQQDESDFYGANAKPLTSAGYERMAKGSGLAPLLDADITTETLPTYPALRRIYREAGLPDGVQATDELEEIARRGFVEYHILAFASPNP